MNQWQTGRIFTVAIWQSGMKISLVIFYDMEEGELQWNRGFYYKFGDLSDEEK